MIRTRLQYEAIPLFIATISGLLLLGNIPATRTYYFGPWGPWCGGGWCLPSWVAMIDIAMIVFIDFITILAWVLLVLASEFKYPRMQPSSAKKLLWIRLIYLALLFFAFVLCLPIFSSIINVFYSDTHMMLFSPGVHLSLVYFAFILSANIIAWIPRYWFG